VDLPLSRVQIAFRPGTVRRQPKDLTGLAAQIHRALRKSLLSRVGFREGLTQLQQLLLATILHQQQFDVVDFLICEMEDVIANSLNQSKGLIYGHIISYLLSQIDAAADPTPPWVEYRLTRDHFPTFKARGPPLRARAAGASLGEPRTDDEDELEIPDERGAEVAAETSSDNADEMPLPSFPPAAHDSEAGGSASSPVTTAPPLPPHVTVTLAQVAQPADLAQILQMMLMQQQQRDEDQRRRDEE
jgi:hypothetical protein